MVEERNALQDTQPAVGEKVSFGKKVVAFLLTMLLLPFFFVGACFGTLALILGKNSGLTIFSALAVLAALAFVGIRVAIRTKNSGLKWGIIVVGVVVVATLVVILVFLSH